MFFHQETTTEQHFNNTSPAHFFSTKSNREMPAVYKSLAKANGEKSDARSDALKKNRQRVLILSSRGVTYRFVIQETERRCALLRRHKREGVLTNMTDTATL